MASDMKSGRKLQAEVHSEAACSSDIAPTAAWKHGMLSRTSFWKENRMGLDVNKQFQNMEVAFVRTGIMAQHSLH